MAFLLIKYKKTNKTGTVREFETFINTSHILLVQQGKYDTIIQMTSGELFVVEPTPEEVLFSIKQAENQFYIIPN